MTQTNSLKKLKTVPKLFKAGFMVDMSRGASSLQQRRFLVKKTFYSKTAQEFTSQSQRCAKSVNTNVRHETACQTNKTKSLKTILFHVSNDVDSKIISERVNLCTSFLILIIVFTS